MQICYVSLNWTIVAYYLRALFTQKLTVYFTYCYNIDTHKHNHFQNILTQNMHEYTNKTQTDSTQVYWVLFLSPLLPKLFSCRAGKTLPSTPHGASPWQPTASPPLPWQHHFFPRRWEVGVCQGCVCVLLSWSRARGNTQWDAVCVCVCVPDKEAKRGCGTDGHKPLQKAAPQIQLP